ncbi:hypothetical protein SLE2022_039180 [Rubroshorea leprosula]
MQNLNNHEQVGQLFNMVIYVRISKEGSGENLHKDIVRRPGLQIEGSVNPVEVARLITEELKNKKHLLLLDEVWIQSTCWKLALLMILETEVKLLWLGV